MAFPVFTSLIFSDLLSTIAFDTGAFCFIFQNFVACSCVFKSFMKCNSGGLFSFENQTVFTVQIP